MIRSGPRRYARAARFAAPQLVDGDEEHGGAICPQLPSRLEHVMGALPGTLPQREDCLALSVVAPDAPGPHPVMVFLHGGAFTSGGGLLPWYDGGALADEQQVVVVGVNYRLGPLGWLCLDGVSPGNLGLLDQLAALRWVHREIARYGGDPEQVTAFGQSAGGVSIGHLLETGEADGLLRRAIVQSGPTLEHYATSRPDAARAQGRRFAALLDADPATAEPGALLDAFVRLAREHAARSTDRVDPPLLPVRGLAPVPADPPAPRPGPDLLVGWNRDELTAFGADLDEAAAPSAALMTPPWTDRATAAYRLDWRPEGSPFGATHCLELPLLLGDEHAWRGSPMLGTTPWSTVERMGRQLRAAWAAFARTGTVDPGLTPDVELRWSPDASLLARDPARTG